MPFRPRSRRRRDAPAAPEGRRYLLLLGAVPLYAACFSLYRAVFFLTFSPGGFAPGDVLRAFLTGARLDLSLSAIVLAPVFALYGLANLLGRERLFRLPAAVYLSAANVVLVVLAVVEFPFYRVYASRLNHLFFEYFDKPKELLVTLSGLPSLLPSVALALLLAAASIWAARSVLRGLFILGPGRLWARLLLLPLGLVLVGTIIRGGVQRRPIGWSAAYFSRHHFLNQAALNGPYNLFHHVIFFVEERRRMVAAPAYMPRAEAIAVIREANGRPAPLPVYLAGLPPRPNIILVFLEGFSANRLGAYGHDGGLSPAFDALASRSVLFTEFFANGTRTSRGLLASLCSFPPLPGVNVTKKIEAQQSFPSVAGGLAGGGYRTLFVYGGDRGFESMGGFYLANGFQRFYDLSDYRAVRQPNPIMVYDEELFENADAILAGTPEPFFAAILTMVNHHPFTLPPDYGDHPELDRERRALAYTDRALGKFMELAARRGYYDRTVFIITADHAAHAEGFVPDRFRIPLLIHSPLIPLARRETAASSQLDLPPTILQLAGIRLDQRDTPFFGASLFSRDGRSAVFWLNEDYFGGCREGFVYRESPGGQGFLFRPGMEPADDPRRLEDLRAYARAVLQTAADNLRRGRVSAAWNR